MHTIDIPMLGLKYQLPSSWSEMTHTQIHSVMQRYFQSIESGHSPLEFNIQVFYDLLNVKHNWLSRYKSILHPNLRGHKHENIRLICEECLSWLTEIVDGVPRITFDLTENILPIISVRGATLIGPAELLQDLTFGEYRQAINAHNSFLKSQKIDELNELLVFLYRKKSKSANLAGRRVAPVNNENFASLVKYVALIPNWQKHLILLWFTNCIKALQSDVITIDGEDINMSLLFSDSEPDKVYPSTWSDLLIQVAKESVIGSRDDVDNQPLYSIFQIMWHNFKEHKNNEKIRKSS